LSQNEARPITISKVHSEESATLHNANVCGSGVDAGALSGRDGWRSVLQRLENVDDTFASTRLCCVTSAGTFAVGLVLRPLAGHVAAAPTLIAFLHACKSIGAAVAAILALWDAQRRISVYVHVLLEDRAIWVLSVASQCFPGGRGRSERRGARRAGCGQRGRCRRFLGVIESPLRDDAV
jgi:hypothetical protein